MTDNKVIQLRETLKDYLDKRNVPEVLVKEDNRYQIESDKLHQLYTESSIYQLYITEFHDDPDVARFIKLLTDVAINTFNSLGTKTSFIDVGCGSGFTGLLLAQSGNFHVTFHDFDGLGLDFIQYYLDQNPEINGMVVPYGLEVPRHTVAVALDVMEHTHNHLSTLKWLQDLGDYVAISYPLMPYKPPFITEIDEYVDDESILYICERNHQILFSQIANGRRFLVYK